MLSRLRWLYPGLNIKRWVITVILGLCFVIFGSAWLSQTLKLTWELKILDVLLVIFGIGLIFFGINRMIKSIIKVFLPELKGRHVIDILVEKRHLLRGPKIVAIGGGTGLSSLLAGLKRYTTNITAIVTVADDGGSSGRLRREFDILPPGDIRNCLVALAEAEPMMRKLFQYRFDKDSDLRGHNFGNLFITAMTQLTGDFEKALKESSKVLAIKGEVLPSTLSKVKLMAHFKDGGIAEGETNIPKQEREIDKVFLKPLGCTPNHEALKSIRSADLIILGPGSLYTSILPNLVIKELAEEIKNSRVLKIYVCNIMTQHGETDGFCASDHLKALVKHTSSKIIDTCFVNTGRIPQRFLEKYSGEKSFPVVVDRENIEKMGFSVVEGNFVFAGDFIRHDSSQLAKRIMEVYFEQKRAT